MSRPVVTVEDRSGRAPTEEPTATDLSALADLMRAVLDAEGVQGGAEAGLHLVDLREITALNGEHMGAVEPTDVLSFPVDGPAASGTDGGVGTDDHGVATGGGLVGDVVLCPQVATAQAADHAGTVLDECRLLVVHGSLHLCGWDHADDDARRRMWRREHDLLSRFDLLPGRDPWGEW